MTDKTLKIITRGENNDDLAENVISPILKDEDFIFLKRDEDYDGAIFIYSGSNIPAEEIIEMLEEKAAEMRKEIEENGFYTWGEATGDLEVVEEN